MPIAYRIETARLVLRPWEPEDAPLMKESVDSSIEHLLPWMPWAKDEPQTLDEKVELARMFRGNFDLDNDYVYGVFEPDESRALGGSGLHRRGGPASLEVGYWIRADSIGKGLATEVTAVLTRVAFDHFGVERVDVQIDPENERSMRIPRKLGFTEEGTLRRRLPPKEERAARRDGTLFTMVREELAGSPCVQFEYVAFDALGRSL